MERYKAYNMRKIKVLQFLISNGKGGRTQAVLENWKFIDKSKIQFDFIAIQKKISFQNEIEASGGNIYYLSCTAEQNRDKFANELDKILDQGYDVIHIHTSSWIGTLVEERAKIKKIKKIIIHSHNTDVSRIEDEDLMKKMKEQHFKVRETLTEDIATDFWACSWRAADWLFGNRISREKIKIVKDAIDSQRFKFNPEVREKYRQRLGIEGKFVLGHIGRFSYQKNQEFLVDLLYEMKKEMSNIILLMEGVGKTKALIIEKINSLHLENSVIILENYEQIEILYQVMDTFVFPSRFEGFGRVLLEAQCAGLMCIASTFVPEDVQVTENIVFKSLDIEVWKEYIKSISYYERKDMSPKILEQGYDIKKNVLELENLYKEVL